MGSYEFISYVYDICINTCVYVYGIYIYGVYIYICVLNTYIYICMVYVYIYIYTYGPIWYVYIYILSVQTLQKCRVQIGPSLNLGEIWRYTLWNSCYLKPCVFPENVGMPRACQVQQVHSKTIFNKIHRDPGYGTIDLEFKQFAKRNLESVSTLGSIRTSYHRLAACFLGLLP